MKLITLIGTGIFFLFSAFIMKKENTTLFQTKWVLKKIYNVAGSEDVATKAFIKFNEDKKSTGGNGSCNSFGSSVTIEGKTITFKNIFSTKMYCADVQEIENSFFSQLGKVTRYDLKDKSLSLYQGDTLLLEFAAA